MNDINLPPLPNSIPLTMTERADLYEWRDSSIRAAVLADREARGEPVAILRRDAKVGLLRVRYTDEVTEVPDGEHPLYLAPQPVEQRQPLSDEQIDSLLFEVGASGTTVNLDEQVCGYVVKPLIFDALVRAIEAHHGITGGKP